MRDSDNSLYGPDYNEDGRYLGEFRDLPVKIHRTREAFGAQFKETFQLHDISDQQFRVLRILSRRDMLETGQLAQLSMLLGPSLSRIVKDLIAKGLVTRHNTSSDGRVYHHRLTDTGRSLVESIIPEFDPLYEGLAGRMAKEEVVELNRLLDKLLSALKDIRFKPRIAG